MRKRFLLIFATFGLIISMGIFAACTSRGDTKYSISFYAETDLIGVVETAGMESIVLPEAPEKEEYLFRGWYFDRNIWSDRLTEDTYAEKPLTKDVSVYAFYERNEEPVPPAETYTVQFETNGGTAVGDMTVSRIETEPVTVKDGFTFLGWYKESGFVNKVEFPYEVTEAQTLYARWEQNGPEAIVFTVDSNGVLTGVSGISAENSKVEVPSVVNGVTVVEIGQGVFKDNQELQTLILPDTVKTIGYQMCSGCRKLSKVRLPEGLTVIPDEAFDQCALLSDVEFPDSLVEIRSDAFWGTGLKKFVAPASLKNIWQYAFRECKNLADVDLGNIVSLGSGAFQDCTALESIKIPETIDSLTDKNDIFAGCTSLKQIDMPDKPIAVSFTLLNNTAYFNDASNWKDGVLYVDRYLIRAGEGFYGKTECIVPEGTIVIAEHAFSDSKQVRALKKVTLPQSLVCIGSYAFSQCSQLAEIEIGDGIQSIGYNAFSGTAYESANWTDNGLYLGNWLIAVKNVEMTSFTVREGTVGIADGYDDNSSSFFPKKARNITALSLPSTLKYIGVRSFARLKITEVTLPAGLLRIGKGGFYSCSFLKKINLGDCRSLESIGEMSFQGAALEEVTIPASVKTIGEMIFNHNTVNLTVHCEVPKKPEGWDSNWSFSYREGVTITVDWKK